MQPISISLRACSSFLFAAVALVAFSVCAHAADPQTPPSPNDKTARNAWALREVVRRMVAGQKVDPALFKEFEDAQNFGLKTGPEAGQRVPDFKLPDENGKQWTLDQLMGPKGLLLAFNRSADW
jgi:opacity protein-like surface antigen